MFFKSSDWYLVLFNLSYKKSWQPSDCQPKEVIGDWYMLI